jgi:hypothetical protein
MPSPVARYACPSDLDVLPLRTGAWIAKAKRIASLPVSIPHDAACSRGTLLGDEGKAAAVTPSAAFAVALRNKWGLRAIRAKGNRESEPRFPDCQRELQRKTRLTTKKMVKSEAHPAYRPWGLTLFPFSSISSFPSSPSSSSSWLFS